MAKKRLPELLATTGAALLTGLSFAFAEPPQAMATSSPQSPMAAPPATAASAAPMHAAAALSGPLQVFFGNLHSHTSYSDGSGTPAEAFAFARKTGHLDFLAITEHNHAEAERGAKERADGVMIATSPELYDGPAPASLVSAADAQTVNGKFVAIYGQEFSTISAGNHANVFDVRGVIDVPKGQFAKLVNEWLPEHPDSTGTAQLIQFNHPFSASQHGGAAAADDDDEGDEQTGSIEYGADDFGSQQAWVTSMDRHAELIEVFNGPGTKNATGQRPTRFVNQYLSYLRLGFHLGPTGDQDNHYRTWGTQTDARTGVIASALTRKDILTALKARHVYATIDRNLRFVARVAVGGDEHLLGDIVPPPASDTPLEFRYVLADDDEPDADYDIDVFSGIVGEEVAAVATRAERTGNTSTAHPGVVTGLTYQGGRQYFLIRLTQKSEHGGSDLLWTAPIWFEQVSAAPPGTPGGPASNSFVSSKNSGIFHVSPDCRFAKLIKAENRVTGTAATKNRTMHAGCPVT